jgi:hypothetical protein
LFKFWHIKAKRVAEPLSDHPPVTPIVGVKRRLLETEHDRFKFAFLVIELRELVQRLPRGWQML